jgi:homoserine dehydrogenase
LLGRAAVTLNETADTGTVCVYVTPTVIPATSTLAKVSGSGNAVQVTSRNLETCTYMGPGAGRLPTANSVVADIYRAAQSTLPMTPFPAPSAYSNVQLNVVTDYSSRFYIRVTIASGSDLENVFSNALAEFGVTMTAVASGPCAVDGSNVYVSVTTETCSKSLICRLCDALQERLHSGIVGPPLYMPILE